MKLDLELLPVNRNVIGMCYNKGMASVKNKENDEYFPVNFYEFCFGIAILTIVFTFWTKIEEETE